MKYAILLFVSAGLLFAACKKKSNAIGCYVCTYVTKKGSNIPIYDTTRAVTTTGTVCNVNSGQIAFFAKTRSKKDTTGVSYTGDSVFTSTVVVTCIAQ
jgi:hypothetical protein